MIDPARLVGTWRLRSWASEAADGGVVEPFGPAPEGVLVYTADGTMITTIGMPGRRSIEGGDLLAASVDEITAMARSFVAYAGPYRLEGGDVVHVVEMSLFPNWVGTEQRRHVDLSDGDRTLVLSSEPFLVRGRVAAQRLIWTRGPA